MLPGKQYKPEDIVQILRRRFWLVVVPFALISAGTAVAVRRLPDYYRSDTLILVVPQKVPEAYVKSTVTTRIEDRLDGLKQQILSRTRLERIIEEFGLYAEERRTGLMEDIVQKMRKDIVIDPRVERSDAFSVTYVGRDPRTVMKVTEKLASMFIDESLHDRGVLADSTNQFLEGQLEDVRSRLVESEQKVQEYKKTHTGQLPTQLASNLQSFSNTTLEIQALIQSIHDDQTRRLMLEKQLADLENPIEIPQAVEPAGASPIGPDGTAVFGTAQMLNLHRASLANLQAQKKLPDHPDVKTVTKLIAEYEKKLQDEALEQPVSRAASQVVSPAEQARRRKIDTIQEQLEQLNAQMAYKLSEEKRLRGEATKFQIRIDAAPTRESEMAGITRDYTQLSAQYSGLLAKKEDSRIAANLERRQIGEQFKLLDAARVPERPFKPDRRRYNLMGMAAGLSLGLALVALLEYRDSTYKTDDELMSVLSLPVLAVVPRMQSDQERRKSLKRRWLLGIGLGGTVAGCLAVLVYTFVR